MILYGHEKRDPIKLSFSFRFLDSVEMSCFLGLSTQNKSRGNEGSFMAGPYEQPIAVWEAVAIKKESSNSIDAKSFTFRELATATNSFRQEFLIGEGGFGRVYKGKLEKTGQVKRM